MKRAAFLLVLLLCGSASAEDYEFNVTVPEEKVEECWLHHHMQSQEKFPSRKAKADHFLKSAVFNPSIKWALDTFVMVSSTGKIREFGGTGITVRPRDEKVWDRDNGG